MEFIFYIQVNIKTSTSWHYFFDGIRHVHSTQNRKLVKFLQYIKKKVMQLLFCSIVMQNIQILYGVSVMFILTCFWVVVVKNGCDLLDQGTLKSALFQGLFDEMS